MLQASRVDKVLCGGVPRRMRRSEVAPARWPFPRLGDTSNCGANLPWSSAGPSPAPSASIRLPSPREWFHPPIGLTLEHVTIQTFLRALTYRFHYCGSGMVPKIANSAAVTRRTVWYSVCQTVPFAGTLMPPPTASWQYESSPPTLKLSFLAVLPLGR